MVSSPIKLNYLNQSLLVDNRIGITGPVIGQNLDQRPGKWILLALSSARFDSSIFTVGSV